MNFHNSKNNNNNNNNELPILPNRWSPLSCLPPQTQTPSGLLSLDTSDGEVELISRSNIELRSSSSTEPDPLAHSGLRLPFHLRHVTSPVWNDRDEDLIVTITTHRIVFRSNSSSSSSSSKGAASSSSSSYAHFLHLSNLTSTPYKSGGNWTTNRSYKIELSTLSHSSLTLVFRSGAHSAKSDRDKIEEALVRSYGRKRWEEASRLQQTQQQAASSATTTTTIGGGGGGNGTRRPVGVEAIVTRNRLANERAKRIAEEAFAKNDKDEKTKTSKDAEVEVLLREAGELVGVIRKYVATLDKNNKKKNKRPLLGDGVVVGEDDEDEDARELNSMLQNMGMVTAVSYDQVSSKSDYLIQLARQIYDYLTIHTSRFAKGGGIMTLTDVYCLFNRARGTNMISPEELLDALNLMEDLGLGMKVREFEESGVRVLQECGFDDDVMAQTVVEYLKTKEGEKGMGGEEETIRGDGGSSGYVGVTALEAGRVLKISALLANEILLGAERNGVLCRDVTISATRFFQNTFATYSY